MSFAPERDASRRDFLLFGVCFLLSLATRIFLPVQWGVAISTSFQRTLLRPLLAVQEQTQKTRKSRAEFAALEGQRDSLALAADSIAILRLENRDLRDLLGLRTRMPVGHVAAEVLHHTGPGQALLTLAAGRAQGIRPMQPVVAPNGLVGVVTHVYPRTAEIMVWSHSDFRASAMTEDGAVFGIVAPAGAAGPNQMLMELTGVPYREQVPEGTMVYTSGLGGIYPRGIPIGQVIAVGTEGEGWSRTYIVRPAVHPAAVSHVIVLLSDAPDLQATFKAPAAGPEVR